MIWMVLLLLLCAVGCATVPVPPPLPPGPLVPLHLGVVGSYHGPLGDADLKVLATSPDLTLRAAVTSLDQAWAIVKAVRPYPTIHVLWLLEEADGPLLEALMPVLLAPAPNPTTGVELGNELDLKGVSAEAFGRWIQAATSALRANGYDGRVVSGGIYSTTPEALAYLTRAGVGTWPADVVVAVHRYGDPDGPVSGYASRLTETAAIRATVAGHPLAFTEFGYPSMPSTEAWTLEAVTRDLGWFRQAGATLATLYQFTDGPSAAAIDHYGIKAIDGRWKPVATALGIPPR